VYYESNKNFFVIKDKLERLHSEQAKTNKEEESFDDKSNTIENSFFSERSSAYIPLEYALEKEDYKRNPFQKQRANEETLMKNLQKNNPFWTNIHNSAPLPRLSVEDILNDSEKDNLKGHQMMEKTMKHAQLRIQEMLSNTGKLDKEQLINSMMSLVNDVGSILFIYCQGKVWEYKESRIKVLNDKETVLKRVIHLQKKKNDDILEKNLRLEERIQHILQENSNLKRANYQVIQQKEERWDNNHCFNDSNNFGDIY